jgi:DNA-binding NarL/FixJ family response regulator
MQLTPKELHAAKGVKGARCRVLVVEDEALFALEIAHLLTAAGFDVLGPAKSVKQALEIIEQQNCEAAVLDITLGLETSERVAVELISRGTRFVTLSGYSREQRPPVFTGVPALQKPVRSNLLIGSIERCLQRDEETDAEVCSSRR